jgi:hypothetical protein
MWKKDGQLVFPETGSGLDILQQGGLLTVAAARPAHSGRWECVASTAWGQDTILYEVAVASAAASSRPTGGGGSRRSCTGRDPPVISDIRGVSNDSVQLAWEVAAGFNASCYEEFMLFWWSREADSTHDNQTAELGQRTATIGGLRPTVVYYFQVNLVRDRELRDYLYGQTKIHAMEYYVQAAEDLSAASAGDATAAPQAVIIVVILVIVILGSLLALLYVKRDHVSQYLVDQRHQFGGGVAAAVRSGGSKKKKKNQHEFAEFSSRLVANPDFMASLAPQWPEPEPEPTEDRAFIQQQVWIVFLQ